MCPPLLPRAPPYQEFVPQRRGAARSLAVSGAPQQTFIFIFLLSRPFCISILALRTGRNLLLVLHRGSSPTGSSQSVSAEAEPGRGAQQGRHRMALPNGTGWPWLPVLSDEGV